MKKPHLEITQNQQIGAALQVLNCEAYFTFSGPGLARDPEGAMRTMHRDFDKHVKQVHQLDANVSCERRRDQNR